MNQLIPDLSYLHNDNSCTDFGDGYSLLRCRPEAMPHSLTTKMSMLTQRRLCRPNSYMESVYDRMNINEATTNTQAINFLLMAQVGKKTS